MPPRVDEARAKPYVRDATPEESANIFVPPIGIETWVGVLDDNGTIKGKICLSRAHGVVFGHETECWSDDAWDAQKLWRAARRKAKEWGATTIDVHFEDDTPDFIRQFWGNRGFKKIVEVHRGSI